MGVLIPIAFLPYIKTQLIYRTVSILFGSVVDHMALLNSDTWCRLNVASSSSNLLKILKSMSHFQHMTLIVTILVWSPVFSKLIF